MRKNPRFFTNTKLTIMSVLLCFCFQIFILSSHAFSVSNQAIINITNQQRTANGLTPLAWNAALSNSAFLKAQDMCNKDYWSHTAPDGTTAWTLIEQSGYEYLDAGENLAKNFTDDTATVAGWMASPGHRANILKSDYSDIGVAGSTCNFQGAETQIVVAHYGTTGAVRKVTPATTPTKAVTRTETAKKAPEVTNTQPLAAKSPAPSPAPVAQFEQPPTKHSWSFIWMKVTMIKLF